MDGQRLLAVEIIPLFPFVHLSHFLKPKRFITILGYKVPTVNKCISGMPFSPSTSERKTCCISWKFLWNSEIHIFLLSLMRRSSVVSAACLNSLSLAVSIYFFIHILLPGARWLILPPFWTQIQIFSHFLKFKQKKTGQYMYSAYMVWKFLFQVMTTLNIMSWPVYTRFSV